MGQLASNLLNPTTVTTELIRPGAITPALMSADSQRAFSKDGQNEASAPIYTIAGVTVTSRIHYVEVYTTKAAIATLVIRQGSDYTVQAGQFTAVANLANNTNNQCIFHYSV